jgi:hypothetical protein
MGYRYPQIGTWDVIEILCPMGSVAAPRWSAAEDAPLQGRTLLDAHESLDPWHRARGGIHALSVRGALDHRGSVQKVCALQGIDSGN